MLSFTGETAMYRRMKPLPRFYPDYYFASEFGEIFSIKSGLPEKLTPSLSSTGQSVVNIKGTPRKVHRLVLEAFAGRSKLQVKHIDGNLANNDLYNLEYVTSEQNIRHKQDLQGAKSVHYKDILDDILMSHLEDNTMSINELRNMYTISKEYLEKLSTSCY